jgi:hypothetical protein
MPEASHTPELHATRGNAILWFAPGESGGKLCRRTMTGVPMPHAGISACGEYAKDSVTVVLKVRESRGLQFTKVLSFPRLASRVEKQASWSRRAQSSPGAIALTATNVTVVPQTVHQAFTKSGYAGRSRRFGYEPLGLSKTLWANTCATVAENRKRSDEKWRCIEFKKYGREAWQVALLWRQ